MTSTLFSLSTRGRGRAGSKDGGMRSDVLKNAHPTWNSYHRPRSCTATGVCAIAIESKGDVATHTLRVSNSIELCWLACLSSRDTSPPSSGEGIRERLLVGCSGSICPVDRSWNLRDIKLCHSFTFSFLLFLSPPPIPLACCVRPSRCTSAGFSPTSTRSFALASLMEYRYLGKSGLMVSCLSLGGWVTYGKWLSLHPLNCRVYPSRQYLTRVNPTFLSFSLSPSLST